MYRIHHDGQLSIEEFQVPFGGTLAPDNLWVLFSSLMPWEELEEIYAPQFNTTTGASGLISKVVRSECLC